VRALSKADRVILPAVFRSSLPDDQRLSAERVVSELDAIGVDARYVPAVDDIVRAVAKDSRPGDLVVIMSNGGFDDIHQKLLTALARR
jgi:UDP-N-acetylmuramate: L-alanyl-gamma-D-glutamyl-meso-diaminopimelate ligase